MSWSRSRKNGIKLDMKKPNLTRITVLLAMPAVMALLAGTSPAAQSAAAKKSTDLPAAVETDPRLKPGGVYGFGFHQAKIIDPALPRVLLIGDSILDGYIRDVTASLNGKANVDFWENPYFQSEELNQLLGKVLGYGPYDAVHFNMGLHGWQKGRIKDATFEPLTEAFVEVLRARLPKAKLIWASSTPVTLKSKPTELDPEINPIIIEHNRMAA